MSKRLDRAAATLQRAAYGPLEVAIVLGSGLADTVVAQFQSTSIRYKKLPGAPDSQMPGHAGTAHVGIWGKRRVVAFAGRVHAYQGYSANDVAYFVRLAAAAGAKTLILTNAAGGLAEHLRRGDLMLVSDHINLTGLAPLDVARDGFVNMVDAYSPRLLALAQKHAPGAPLPAGVYAGVRGPAYETHAEARALRAMGADAVGMSTVLETIAARALGLEVLAISTITNVMGASDVAHTDVLAVASEAGERLARTIEAVLFAL